MQVARLHRSRWARHGLGVLAVGAVVGLIGPYGTFFEMPLQQRWLYWTAIAALSWTQWLLLEALLERWTDWPIAAIGCVTAFVFAALLAAELFVINPLVGLGQPLSFAELYLWVAGTGLLLFWLSYLIINSIHRNIAQQSSTAATEIPFLSRIPAGIAGELLCLETEDHYLRIHTSAGNDLILMRLRDAVKELDAADGLQVHRSYWVARSAVSGSQRRGRRWHLTLKNGLEVPVSASHLTAVREAGWLT